MKNKWKKGIALACTIALTCAFMLGAAFATGPVDDAREDSEASLRWLLGEELGSENFRLFEYGDYDGDGIYEAFAFICTEEDPDTGTVTGDLWFVSPLFCEPVQTGLSYYELRKLGNSAPILFTAEEGYGGSGSRTYLWSVVDSAPVAVEADIYGGFEIGEGNEFYAYPSAFDGYSDGTGHSWKQYYFYLDGLEMREYGGLYISRDQLMMFDGASEIVQREEAQNKTLVSIIYRENGIINLNFCENGSHALKSNTNVTLRYNGPSVTLWNEDIGVYELACDPARAVYPASFVLPEATAAAQATSTGSSEAEDFDAWMNGGDDPADSQTESDATDSFDEWMNAPSSTPAAAAPQIVQATADVNVRTGPSLSAAKLGIMTYGEYCTYLGESRMDERGVVWYKLDYNGREGWASSTYAELRQGGQRENTSNSTATGAKVHIVGGKANIRSGPGLNYESVGSMKEGRVVDYLGRASTDSRGVTWYYISFQGKIGWVSSKYARLY